MQINPPDKADMATRRQPADSCLRARSSALVFLVVLLTTTGCASRSFAPQDPTSSDFVARGITQSDGPLRVTAAVPDSAETAATFGLSLYEQGIQPVWLKVENLGDSPVRVTLWSVDPDYYSPLEVAWMHRGGFSNEGKAAMEKWFYESALPRRIPAGESRAGFVYTHFRKGTKGFNLDAFTGDDDFSFTFFVPMPGFNADYMQVDFDNLYDESEIQRLTRAELRTVAESIACCSSNDSGDGSGDPLNVIMIGSGPELRRALLRSGWDETASDDPQTAVAREQRFQGRRPDGTFEKSRADGAERKELRLWLAPMQVDDQNVWVGQASQELHAEGSGAEYRIDPDIDRARDYTLQNFWYGQSLERAGFAKGVPPASNEMPRETFSGSVYFTDGLRVVMWLADEPVGLDEAEILLWELLGDE